VSPMQTQSGVPEQRKLYELATMFMALPEPVMVLDPLGKIIWSNPAAETLFNRELSSADIGSFLPSIITFPNGRPVPYAELPSSRALRGETVARETFHLALGAAEYVVNITAAPLMQDEQIVGVILLCYDMTEYERELATARLCAEELDATFTSLTDGLIICNKTGQIVRMNPAAEQLFHYDATERDLPANQRLTLRQFITRDGHPFPRVEFPITRALAGETVPAVLLGIENPDGVYWLTVSAAPIRATNGEIIGAVTSSTDVTERIRADAALRESEETALTLLNATPDTAFLVDNDGMVLAANEMVAVRLHCPLSDIIGRHIQEMLAPETRLTRLSLAEKVRRTGQPMHFDDVEGENWFDNTIYPILDGQGNVIRLAIFSRDITAQKHTEERLHQLAYFDHLTGLPNRFLLYDRLTQTLAHRKRRQAAMALLFLDLDNFKEINDTLGHSVGDLVLLEVARRLCRCVRESDTVARMGGDEFVIIIPDLEQPRANARVTASRIQEELDVPFYHDNRAIPLAASIGITIAPADGDTPETLLKHADVAMYRAKELGRNRFVFYADETRAPITERGILERALRGALDRHEFQLDFQPQFDLRQTRITGVEALLRWHHPELGLIPPMRFLPAAEELDCIDEIGAWILLEACQRAVAWRIAGAHDLTIAVNISPGQFVRSSLVEQCEAALRTSGLPPQYLELELPEFLVGKYPERLLPLTQRLRTIGVNVAIDDVGMGYSSLEYIHRYPLTTLKIDGSFIRHIGDDLSNATAVQTVIQAAHQAGLTVVAECVETPEQLTALRALDCDRYQGYLCCRPIPADQCALVLAGAGVVRKSEHA